MKKFKEWLALTVCTGLLAACGGGGGNPGSTGGGTTTPPVVTPPVSKVTSVVLVSSSDTIASSGADGTEVTLTVVVKDVNNNVLPDQAVDFKASSGAVAATAKNTDATGTVTAKLSTKGDASLRTITITATAGPITSAEKKIQVVASVPVQVPTLTLALLNSSGGASNSLTSVAPLTARAIVKDKDGRPVPNALVNFISSSGANGSALVAFSPSAGTTLTDANGVADATMRPASLVASGAGTVTVSTAVAGTNLSAAANFSVGATAITLSPLVLTPPTIGAYGSTVISVDVLAGNAKYTEQQMNVAFTSACVTAGKATLAASAPTSGGTAQVVYRDQGCGNNDLITATLNSGASTPATASATLAIESPKAASIQFVAAAPTDKSIVIKGEGGFGRTETASLTFKVVDIFGKPLAAQKVNFSNAAGQGIVINKDSDSTDANGEVITTVNSGTVPTSFRIRATLAGNTAVSTISDSIVVTTGKPVQRAFSLSVVSPNVEGWTYDSGPVVPATNVNILVADQAGNPVPDGLPVVFQTNLASVGSSSKGACNTVNGGCSVDFRTQAPRTAPANTPVTPCNSSVLGFSSDSTRTGLATVCASTTDGTNTLFAKIGIFLSGSFAENVYLNDAAVTTPVRLDGQAYDLGVVGANDSRVFTLQLNDVNNNPMPAGTRVDITNAVNAAATGVSPAAVQNVFAHTASGDASTGTGIDNNSVRQGSFHTVTVGSVQPKPCLTELNATFNVTVTTPRNNVTTYPFKLRFSCP